ncbi:MAG: oligopeptide/dipeptide ABC transporter ATP-binding protein [Clostridia bacterium]
MEKNILLKVNHLKQYFPLKKSLGKERLFVRANDDISIAIYEGETLGLVGESGCGKSTLGRTLLQLYNQTEGETLYYAKDVFDIVPKYFVDAVSNVDSMREKARNAKKAYDEYLAKPLDSQKEAELHKLFVNYTKYYSLMTKVLGGFYVIDDLSEFKSLLLQKLEVSNKRSVVLKNLEKARLQKNVSEIAKLEAEFNEYDLKVASHTNKIKELKEPLLQNEEFAEFEKYLDRGIDLTRLKYSEMRTLRVDLQLIFQDPYSSLDPRMTVGQIISESLITHKVYKSGDPSLQEYVIEIMQKCGLAPYMFHRYPHQFSGGQRQRIGIARSLAMKPRFMVCDEAVSALDVSIQSQVINLLQDLRETENLTYLFISHDLSVVKYISDRIGVMYLGNMVELCSAERIFTNPLHPYTQALLHAIPSTDIEARGDIKPLEGDIPSPIRPPAGCKFHTRCEFATDICKKDVPIWEEIEPDHFVSCHHCKKG